MARDGYIKLSGDEFNIAWLKSTSESYAVQVLVGGGIDKNKARNAWKQANGLSVRNYTEAKAKVRPKPKKEEKEAED